MGVVDSKYLVIFVLVYTLSINSSWLLLNFLEKGNSMMMTINQMATPLSVIWAGAFRGSGLVREKENEAWKPDISEFAM